EESAGTHADGSDVVDQHVDAAVLLGRVPDQLRRPVGRGQVDRDRGYALEAVEGAGSPRAGYDMCALVREGPGRGHSNALACSRDDRDLAGQVQVHGCSLDKASVTSLPVLSWLAQYLDHIGHAPDGSVRACRRV